MFTFEIRFYPKSFKEPFINEFDENMQWFISCLYKNGQILKECQNTVKFSGHYAYRVVAPEMDSLAKKHYNKYCRKFLSTVSEKSLKEPEVYFIGENYDARESCNCENTSHYILFFPYRYIEYPILCGDCHRSVPLYKLPKTYDDEEYHDVHCWEQVYRACDTQFMNGIGERHGYKMMSDPNSELSREGLRICAYWEKCVKKSFYYFLFKYYKKNKSACPKCNESWVNKDKKMQYDYVCKKCRLVSNDMQ